MNDQSDSRPDLHGFPLVLVLAHRKVVVVGAGNIATRKVQGLLMSGATNITVVAPDISDTLRTLGAQGVVTLVERNFQESDINDAYFVITATNVADVNRAVFIAGEARNTFVNSADDPKNCSAILMSTVRQGDITIGISTAGKSPAFAKWCRRYLEGRLGPEYSLLIELVNQAREGVRAQGISSEDINWDPAFDFSVVEMARNDDKEAIRCVLSQLISDSLGREVVLVDTLKK